MGVISHFTTVIETLTDVAIKCCDNGPHGLAFAIIIVCFIRPMLLAAYFVPLV